MMPRVSLLKLPHSEFVTVVTSQWKSIVLMTSHCFIHDSYIGQFLIFDV